MAQARFVFLSSRGVLRVAGDDRRAFLQGLVSNDVNKAGPERAIWSAFLTPQGKFLHEFFLSELSDAFLLEGEAERLEDLKRRLSMYKLRSKVTIEALPGMAVAAVFGAPTFGLPDEPGVCAAFGDGVACVDPRLSAAGVRVVLPRTGAEQALSGAGLAAAAFEDYDRHRIALGLPDGSRDLAVDKAILLENGFDELHGVDWQKGCYMGQELTARTKYRGLIKKRLLPVSIEGPAPAAGTPLLAGGTEAGEMRSSCGDVGLALIRLEHLDSAITGLRAGEARVRAVKPDWLALPA
jgi:folate-binding protein YgfZ